MAEGLNEPLNLRFDNIRYHARSGDVLPRRKSLFDAPEKPSIFSLVDCSGLDPGA